ncbi:MAG: Nucleolar protein 9 [Pycnora praestabilis]|nr:MAG: Nucleolar protein 9 [Pycnora praestabilis]
MPQEKKKRGRREENKRKQHDPDAEKQAKKQRSDDYHAHSSDSQYLLTGADLDGNGALGEIPFYGMLDEEEQEYFKRADEMLELNQFRDIEERSLFLANVYQEANGKELKIANSQSCSRLMERLILLSTSTQLKNLFGKFNGHFLPLVQHRFASHCCESLFMQSAPIVTQEFVTPLEEQRQDGEIFVSMENLFLHTLNELEGNMGYLLTDRFASHVLRVLLLVLSGQPLSKSATSLLRSKKKENVGISGISGIVSKATEPSLENRAVPESFQLALGKTISATVAGLDTTYLRALATHPTGNPVLQLLLELEQTTSVKQKTIHGLSLLQKLLPDDPLLEGTDSATFFNGLLYDPIGSRLLETIVRCSPGKYFKMVYKSLIKSRIGNLARNETAGFVVIKLLERLNKEDLEEAIVLILPQIQSLVERSRTSVIKTLIERCAIRGAETLSIAKALATVYGDDSERILKMLQIGPGEQDFVDFSKQNARMNEAERMHGSLLAQSMLAVPGQLSEMVYDSLLALPVLTLISIEEDPIASHVTQAALALPTSTPQFRRKIIQRQFGYIARLATHASGSHVIDSFWIATQGLNFVKERIAEELLENEVTLRESFVGRAVWRNWMMDLFKRRKPDWIAKAKSGYGGAKMESKQSMVDINGNDKGNENGNEKSGIELARQKFAAAKARKQTGNQISAASGANGASVNGRLKRN